MPINWLFYNKTWGWLKLERRTLSENSWQPTYGAPEIAEGLNWLLQLSLCITVSCHGRFPRSLYFLLNILDIVIRMSIDVAIFLPLTRTFGMQEVRPWPESLPAHLLSVLLLYLGGLNFLLPCCLGLELVSINRVSPNPGPQRPRLGD